MAVYIAAVANNGDIDRPTCVIDFIDNAVVTDAYSPESLLAAEFYASCRSWFGGEGYNSVNYSFGNMWREILKFLAGGAGDCNAVVSHLSTVCV